MTWAIVDILNPIRNECDLIDIGQGCFMLSIPFIVFVNKVYCVITSENKKKRICYLLNNL